MKETVKRILSGALRLDDIAIVVYAYRQMERGFNLGDVQRELRLAQKALKTQHNRLSEALGGMIFWGGESGGSSKVVQSDDVKLQILHFESILENSSAILKEEGHEPVIRIASTLELLRSFLFESTRRFRLKCPDLAFLVDFDSDLTVNLRRSRFDGRHDIIVAGISDLDDDQKGDIYGRVQLPLHVMFDWRLDREKWLGIQTGQPVTIRDFEKHIEDFTLVIRELRDPTPKVPEDILRNAKRVIRASTYQGSYANVLASDGKEPVCCVGFPQLLPNSERCRFLSIPTNWPPMKLGIYRPKSAASRWSKRHSVLCDSLIEHFSDEMKSLDEAKGLSELIPRSFTKIWNSSLDAPFDGKARSWKEGRFSRLVTEPKGYFRASHEIPWGNEQVADFTISGRVTTDADWCHLVWRGWDRLHTPTPDEVYTASFFGPINRTSRTITSDHLCGIWQGRATHKQPRGYVPDLGYMIIAKEDSTVEKCCQWAKEYQESAFGKSLPPLPIPDLK